MWTLTGPFDGEAAGEVSSQKAKLLKTGKTYPLGRKECPLIIANKKISSHHCEFVVKPFSVEDATDPTRRPTLEFLNKKDRSLKVNRAGVQLPVNPQTAIELHDGDIVGIISGVFVTVKWVPLCCYVQPVRGKSPVSLEACASLGINVVHVPDSHVTHHLLSTYTAVPVVAASLLSACQFAKPEWLGEVIRLGSLPKNSDPSNGVALEQTFSLPPISRYRPAYSPSLSVPQKEFRVWEPNEERLSLFAGYRFLCVDEKARELDGDFKLVIERGGGSYETFDPSGGTAKFHKALVRGQAKEGKKLVVVGKEKSIIAAIGQDGWKELVAEAKTFELRIIEPDVVLQVVIDVDTSLFEVKHSADIDVDEVPESHSLPDFIPNTHPEEPSLAPPEPEQRIERPRRLVRRATSRQASQEPSIIPAAKTPEPEEPIEVPRPRKALTRRVNAGLPLITGLDDPSSILDVAPDVSAPTSPPPQSAVLDLTAPTPARSTRLKRRVVGGAPDSLVSQPFSLGIDEPTDEPPLKKFKALFEASHPDNAGMGSFEGSGFEGLPGTTYGSSSQTQTQSQTQGKSLRTARSAPTANLSTLREEEEETQTSGVNSRGIKRSRQDDQEDVEMEEVESVTVGTGSGPSQPKKRAVEHVNAVETVGSMTIKPPSTIRAGSKPPSTIKPIKSSKGGAQPGNPDQDTAFLKAIASTKRGKKTEDEFDRDFNKLRISKPDLAHEEPEKEWELLGDFGDDTNVRGNFMVVVEMPVYNRRATREKKGDPVADWQGKPNFKKFKKKDGATRSARVELVVSEENDYGMGAAYWKGGNSQRQSQGDFASTQHAVQVKSEAQTQKFAKAKSQAAVVNDSDSDESEIVPRKGRAKPASSAGSAVPTKRTSRSTKSSAKSQPLFVDSDEENSDVRMQNDDIPEDSDEEQTLRSTAPTNTRSRGTQRTTRAPTRAKKAAPILVDDDSDDGAVFKGFKAKQRR
ncbi:Nibrin [Hypsizygus marmoreus]|uniref:Nibrin n=1 Tax=Hypsizygus marmoreus TaxID=39966 RepID=A0A369JQV7_HYPMA|nr:Nibrin [Hypsizygus marmoreus]